MKRLALALIGLILATHPASAQWQVQAGSVPIGRGQGVIGFNNLAPGVNGNCITSSGGTWVASPCAGSGGGFTTPCALNVLLVGTGVGLPPGCVTLLPADNVPVFTGDVTSTGASLTLAIANNVVTNTKLAPMAGRTVKANITGGSANPTDVPIATSAQRLAGTTDKFIEASTIYLPETVVTFGATTTFDFSTFLQAGVTLTGNITTMNVSNVAAGRSGTIAFIQDATGSRTSVFNSVFKFPNGVVPGLTTTANSIDILSYACRTATFCTATLLKDVK